jgi:hypothetical protein
VGIDENSAETLTRKALYRFLAPRLASCQSSLVGLGSPYHPDKPSAKATVPPASDAWSLFVTQDTKASFMLAVYFLCYLFEKR